MDPVSQARATVALDLRAGGVLDRRLPGYEERPAQVQMAEAVASALANGEHALIEAATGTGKSIAYLLPVVRSDKKALVATANKALQEQLFYKDIPFIAANVQPVESALIKGMGNYLCLQHLEDERQFQHYAQNPAFDQLDALTDDARFDGDLDVVRFQLPAELRRRVAADSDDCAWRECAHFNDCYVRKMREKAQDAQIVVVNHTLLLLDVLMDGWLLPDRDMIIIDEAHHLEDEATRAFTATVNPRRVETLLSQRRLRDHCDPQRLEEAVTANVLLWVRMDEIAYTGWQRGRLPLTGPVEEGLRLATAIADVASALRVKKAEFENDPRESQLFGKLITRADNLKSDLRLVFGMKDRDNRVYYIEREQAKRGREAMLSVSAAPLSVTELLKEKLFDQVSVIATSATLAIDGNFSFYKKQVGVTKAKELVLPLAFDYHTNALLYVPRMRQAPAFGAESGPYLDELATQMADLVRASRGRAFLLFTSTRTLNETWARISPDLEDEGFVLLAQDGKLGRAELLRRFREGERAVLFGLRSFWEGVDVAGEALSLVAIDKLPFDPPDDPVHEARVSRMKAAGENWFGDYVLPLAILRLKQGVGRLLRTKTDRGVLAILDSRLLTKGYGRQVIYALPPARRTLRIDDVRAFFAEETP
jgi:Rad3-related DNA helicase